MDWIKTTPILLLILSGPTCATNGSQTGTPFPHPDGGSDDSTDSQTDPIEDSGADSDTDSDTDTDSDGDTDTQVPDSGSDTDADTDTDSDSDSDVDTDTDSDSDTGPDPCSGDGVWLDEGWSSDVSNWPGTRCWQDPPAPTTMTWAAAVAYCAGLELARYDDWVLPNVNELRYIGRGGTAECNQCGLVVPNHLTEADIENCEPCVPQFGGSGAGGCYWPEELDGSGCAEGDWPWPIYWSTSELWDDPEDFAWSWGFEGNWPSLGARNKTAIARVRCVRPL